MQCVPEKSAFIPRGASNLKRVNRRGTRIHRNSSAPLPSAPVTWVAGSGGFAHGPGHGERGRSIRSSDQGPYSTLASLSKRRAGERPLHASGPCAKPPDPATRAAHGADDSVKGQSTNISSFESSSTWASCSHGVKNTGAGPVKSGSEFQSADAAGDPWVAVVSRTEGAQKCWSLFRPA